MSGRLGVVLFVLLTAVCWGVYGPLMLEGQATLGRLRPFVCVGLAYFVIAVVVPVVWLRMRGEAGSWTSSGVFWSLIAGAVGALGALGIILAFSFKGRPVYVMPLVFGLAPVVNTILTMYLGKLFGQIGPLFLAGLIIVVLGAVTVLVFKPSHGPAAGADQTLGFADFARIASFIAMTAICWGAYGPILHKGQVAMHGSRFRPFICVGLAYFLIAVLAPIALLSITGLEADREYGFAGTMWSLAGGAAGALGALGIILAFNAGGKPVFVMPLVFGGAPVVNSLTEVVGKQLYDHLSPMFFAGLILVIAGAVTVLLFAPKPQPHGAK